MRRVCYLLFLVVPLLIGLSGCHTVPAPKKIEITLKDICALNDVQWQWDSVSQVVTLRKGAKDAKIILGSDVVVTGGEKVYLSEPLKRRRGEIFVPNDFKSKVIDRLFQETPPVFARERKSYKIIVDPGHGGKDPGAIGRLGTKEKDVVLDIGRKLKDDLARSGFEVIMTRNRDEFISLEERTEIASGTDANLFISVHANASPSRSVDGVEVYTLRTLEYKEKTEEQRIKNHRVMFNHLAMERNQPFLNDILEDMLFTNKCAESPKLASMATQGICRETKADSRGVKRAGFFVLRNTLIPAILVEVGYLSNSREERLLQSGEYRQKIADGLAASIVSYVGSR